MSPLFTSPAGQPLRGRSTCKFARVVRYSLTYCDHHLVTWSVGVTIVSIPPFDPIYNVLPPHLGDPTDRSHLSPYPCSTTELCERFATSHDRVRILQGFLSFRAALSSLGIQGFQWLAGSFMEDIETQEQRAPGDIDVVTFVGSPTDLNQLSTLLTSGALNLLDHAAVKQTYHVDHYLLPLVSHPIALVDSTRYWYGLFSHRRDGLWKGMLAAVNIDPADDANATAAITKAAAGLVPAPAPGVTP